MIENRQLLKFKLKSTSTGFVSSSAFGAVLDAFTGAVAEGDIVIGELLFVDTEGPDKFVFFGEMLKEEA